MPRTFYQKNGYDVFLTIGGASIPRSWIIGSIKVIKSENQSTLATFSLLHPAGVQTPESYQGARVTLDIRVAAGIYRIFTGVIDVPELDIINQISTYRCTDNRENKINTLPSGYIQSIGFYSVNAFGQPKDPAEELSKRLSTIPYSLDFDNYGNPVLTPWLPKSVADFTLLPNQVYYRDPRVDFSSRIKTINTVSIAFDYSYQRLHQQNLSYGITVYTDLRGWFTGGRGTFPTRDMVAGAAKGVGWTVRGITYIPLWPAQGFTYNGGVVIWQPNQVETTYRNRVDGSGNPVTDVHGNPVQEQASVTITDTSSNLCLGASWSCYLRFGQNVTERYTLSMTAPQSVAKYGTISAYESYSTSAEYDNAVWEKSLESNNDPEGNFYLNQDYTRGDLNNAFICVLNKARTTLLASHRDVNVYFKKFIWPQVDLKHTVFVNTTPLEAKGKVMMIEHDINIQTSEAITSVTLALSRIQGSASNSALSIPTRPAETSYVGDTITHKRLGVHLGVDIANYPNANGYFGNLWVQGTATKAGYKTNYPEAMVVDTPDIPSSLRDTRTLATSSAYTIAIPNDHLVVRY